jgi:type IV pilus assembly protein PilE
MNRFFCLRSKKKNYPQGFSLIELMIVVAIIAVLAAIAYPSYVSYITRTHRVAAEGCLSQYANYMERYYTTNLSYKADSSGAANPVSVTPPLILDCANPQQAGANYNIDLPAGSLSVSSYVVEAVPTGAQLTRDTMCGTLTLDQTGARNINNGTGTVAQCW